MDAKNKRTVEQVLAHHVKALTSRDLDAMMEDYTDESVVINAMATAKGLAGIRQMLQGLLGMFTPELAANMKTVKQEIVGEYALAIWSALPLVPFGVDSFHVKNGRILMQTAAVQMKTG